MAGIPSWLPFNPDNREPRDSVVALRSLLMAVSAGLFFIYWQNPGVSHTAILWALACLALGSFIGFLFGIPRVLQKDEIQQPARPASGTENTQQTNGEHGYQMHVNTNLEQISDWLTKIIVGVSLIQLGKLPGLFRQASLFMAGGMGQSPEAPVRAMAIIVYFGVVGFLGGYVLTRLYLTVAFVRADLYATLRVGGEGFTVTEAVKRQGNLISDMLEQLSRLQQTVTEPTATPEKVGEMLATPPQLKVRSILWVDDNPKNNSYMVETLTKMGLEVVTSLSTSDALSKLKARKFDRIISDMGRQEGNTFNKAAGIDLVKTIRATDKDTPIIIHCSVEAAKSYTEEALAAGANEVTPSPTRLLAALRLEG